MPARRFTTGLSTLLLVLAASAAADQPDQELRVVTSQSVSYSTGMSTASSGPTVSVMKCISNISSDSRVLRVQAKMTSVSRTTSMWMRMHLWQKVPGLPAEERIVPGHLGVWRSVPVDPKKGKKVEWTANEIVNGGLLAPAVYWMQVEFEWHDAAGNQVILPAARKTKDCAQLDMRPNLYIASVKAESAASSSTIRYTVTIGNSGNGSAPASKLRLSVPGHDPLIAQAPTIAARKTALIVVNAPRCASGTVDLLVNPDSLIAETDATDNSRHLGCAPA